MAPGLLPPEEPARPAGRGALALYVAAVVYASLNPFAGWRAPDAITLFDWPRYWGGFDLALNFAAYVPLGVLLAGGKLAALPAASRTRLVVESTLTGASLSIAMELLQTLLPQRVSSPLDVLANASGSLAGALLVCHPLAQRLAAGAGRALERRIDDSHAARWGGLLLTAWLFAQLNPLVPLFESGQFTNPFDLAHAQNPYDARLFLPAATGIAFNAAGFALLVSLVMRAGAPVFGTACSFIVLAFVLKAVMAALMLRAPSFAEGLSPAAVAGVAAGLLLSLLFGRVGERWRAFAAALLVFAGGLLARVSTEIGAVDTTLRLLNWPHGHVATFAGLTRWVHDNWALAACLYASWRFLRPRQLE